MNRIFLLHTFIITLVFSSGFCSNHCLAQSSTAGADFQNPIKENQILYNGKVWRNLYYYVKGDQFLFSRNYLYGSLTINGKSFPDILIKYDIYNDEILTPTNNGFVLQLNKEMVDSFTLDFENKTYRFLNSEGDSISSIKGYVNVLYKGKSSLYVKYKNEIDLLAVDGKYDQFFQSHRIYFLKDGVDHQISRKNDLLKLLEENKTQVKDFMKKNKLHVSKKSPESFIPVLQYYDSIRH